MQPLERPLVLDELAGEPVEQFGMRGGRAADAEVVFGGDEPLAKMMLPDAVDDHPRGERVVRPCQPVGQVLAAAARLVSRQRIAPEHGQKASRHLVTGPRRLATLLDLDVFPLAVGHPIGRRKGRGEPQPIPLALEAGDGGVGLLDLLLDFFVCRFCLLLVDEGFLRLLSLLDLGIDHRDLLVVWLAECRQLIRGHERHHVGGPLRLFVAWEGEVGALEDAIEGVVVGRGDRIVFVIVAAGAADREAHYRLAERVDRVDRVLEGEVHVIDRVETKPPGDRQVAGGSDAVGKGIGRRRRRQEIAGHLLADEDVVGLVVVERLDDVVAILPGKRCRIVARLAGRVGIADDIKPVPAPSLTVGGRCQQPFDQ